MKATRSNRSVRQSRKCGDKSPKRNTPRGAGKFYVHFQSLLYTRYLCQINSTLCSNLLHLDFPCFRLMTNSRSECSFLFSVLLSMFLQLAFDWKLMFIVSSGLKHGKRMAIDGS